MRLLTACKNCKKQYDVSGHATGENFHCVCGGLVSVSEPQKRDARLVRCASCGGSRGDGKNCEFCGARFSAADKGWGSMCPGCYCRLPVDAGFCVECGLKINPQKLESIQSNLACPRCKDALQSRKLGTIDIFECAACAGMWLPARTFDAICKDKEAMTAVNSAAGLTCGPLMRFSASQEEKVTYIPCPTCKRLMNRRNFGNISGVIIDTCKECGIWLDNTELGQIVKFIDAGGMEKSRETAARNQAHTEKMRTKAIRGIPLLPLENPRKERHELGVEIIIPRLLRAVEMLAKAFRKK